MRLFVIGGSDAGISAALRARELDPDVDVHMLVADAFPNYSICGLPFYLSGEITDWRTLAHRTLAEIEATGVKVHPNETVTTVDVATKQLSAQSAGGTHSNYEWDRLVIGTGASPVRPRIPGMDASNVFVLHSMDECFALRQALDSGARSAVIVGGGYIGLEMADALRHRDIEVTLVEQLPAVMKTVDAPMADRVEALLRDRGVRVRTLAPVESIAENHGRPVVRCSTGESFEADLALVVVGVRPESALAKSCGVLTDERGAILVDRGMRTNVPDVLAAGDCVVTWHGLLERNLYLPLGTTSHKQGRIAGENALGGDRLFAGSFGTQSVKLFDRVVAATGLREEDCRNFGFDPLANEFATYDHKVYYPGATELVVRIVGDSRSGQLLGGQIFGAYGKEVSKRIDTLATTLLHRMSVDSLSDLDLSYTPPLSSPWDPVQMAAQDWIRKRDALVYR